jgi:hypothetical protein
MWEQRWRLRRRWSRSGAAARARRGRELHFHGLVTVLQAESCRVTCTPFRYIRYVLGLCLLDGRCSEHDAACSIVWATK